MTQATRDACAIIIQSTAAIAAADCGVPGATSGPPLKAVAQRMVVDLGRVFNIQISEAVARTLAASTPARANLALETLSFIPVAGWTIRTSAMAKIVESFGWNVAEKLDQGWTLDSEPVRRAEETFGPAVAAEWMTSPCVALDNRCPIDLIHTPEGRIQTLDVLNCIDNGFFY